MRYRNLGKSAAGHAAEALGLPQSFSMHIIHPFENNRQGSLF